MRAVVWTGMGVEWCSGWRRSSQNLLVFADPVIGSPDRRHGAGLADLAIGSDQRHVFDQRSRPDDSIRWILRVSPWKPKRSKGDSTVYGQHDESQFHLRESGFDTDV